MKHKMFALGLVLGLGALVVSGCAAPTSAKSDTGLANPASVYCQDQGYTLEMRTDENGTYGVCVFPDGSECEEWAYFQGECGPGTGEMLPTEAPILIPTPIPDEEVAETAEAEQETVFDYAGWGTYTNEAFEYTLRYPADTTVQESPQGTGIQLSGPLADNEHWPLIEISYFDSEFYHPPSGTDLQQWILDHIPSYDTVDTETEIAGLPTVHLAYEASPQAYAFDEYYLVKGGQLFRIVIIHTGGQQDWELYNQFLQGLAFLDA